LQSIIERNSHIAIVSVPLEGHDEVSDFVKQLQERMHRVRAFTRTSAIRFKEHKDYQSLKDVPQDTKIAIPKAKLHTWNALLGREGIPPDHFKTIDPEINERHIADAFRSARWDAILVDVRLIQDVSTLLLTVREHMDFVIPDSFMELPPVRKLIELILSEEYWMWLETQTGCDISQRGLLE
jgi:hypothetical protein